jgi:antitoxin MazE
MLAKVQQWGNSQGIRIPKALLEDARINVGDEVTVAVKNGTLIVTPVRINRKKYNLQDLVAKIPKGSRSKETDWGKPVGNEVW